jgi:hypothetical protein
MENASPSVFSIPENVRSETSIAWEKLILAKGQLKLVICGLGAC